MQFETQFEPAWELGEPFYYVNNRCKNLQDLVAWVRKLADDLETEANRLRVLLDDHVELEFGSTSDSKPYIRGVTDDPNVAAKHGMDPVEDEDDDDWDDQVVS